MNEIIEQLNQIKIDIGEMPGQNQKRYAAQSLISEAVCLLQKGAFCNCPVLNCMHFQFQRLNRSIVLTPNEAAIEEPTAT